MKQMRWYLVLVIGVLILSLAACGGASSEIEDSNSISSESAQKAAEGVASSDRDFADIPPSALIPIGTLMLEESPLAVDSTQAADLLPLLKAYRSLVESETSSIVEIDAVLRQIENTMTEDQLQAIADMNLSRENMFGMMDELGLEAEGFQPGANAPDGVSPGEFLGPGGGQGGGAGGGPGGGNRSGELGQDLTPEQMATIEARREEFGGSQSRFTIIFVEALIELLEAI